MAATPVRTLSLGTLFELGTMFQLTPFQCSISPPYPTAQTLFVEIAATALRVASELGLGTIVQAPQLDNREAEVTPDLGESLRGLPAACVGILTKRSKAKPTAKTRSREKTVVSVKREEGRMKTLTFKNLLTREQGHK